MGIKELRAKYSQPFDTFYEAYPRKVDRHRAFDVFIELMEEGVDPYALAEQAKSFAQNVDPRELQWTPSPKTWLRDRRWEDNDLFTDQRVATRQWLLGRHKEGDAAAVAARFGFIYTHPVPPDDADESWHLDQRKLWIKKVGNHLLHGGPLPE